MYDLIVLGGGPAGLTAAVYAIRKRLDVLLISPDRCSSASVKAPRRPCQHTSTS